MSVDPQRDVRLGVAEALADGDNIDAGIDQLTWPGRYRLEETDCVLSLGAVENVDQRQKSESANRA
jgi:hypothetical protein